MSDILLKAVDALNAKISGGFDGIAKMVIEDEGALIIDSEGARAGDDDADVTLSATADVFEGILDGSTNATAAFMSGQLKIDGDMGAAMRLAGILG